MKNIKAFAIILFWLLSSEFVISQSPLGSCTISHKENWRYNPSTKWKSETKKTKSLYRNLSFDLTFDENCKYTLQNPCTTGEQTRKQKVMKLCTNQDGGGVNSLRVGWCYDPGIDKICLAFYAHINHFDGKGAGAVGREHALLNVEINTNQQIHVKMAIGKKGMFMSINNEAVVVSRDIFSWSSGGETTYVRANSYFEYKDTDCKKQGAPQDMTFYIDNAYFDDPDFSWEKIICEYTAENITFMNSLFSYYNQGPHKYFAGNRIYCSVKSPSAVNTGYSYDPPFTVLDPAFTGIDVRFYAGNSIILDKGFHAKAGSHFIAKITPIVEPVYPQVILEPEKLAPTVYYEVKNTEHFDFTLYADKYYLKEITGGTGTVNGNTAYYTFLAGVFETLENGHYYARCKLSNDCNLIFYDHHIFKYDKSVVFGDVIKTSKVSFPDYKTEMHNSTGYKGTIIQDLTLGFNIYPNPNPGMFTLQFYDSQNDEYSIEIINMVGKTVYKKQNVKQGNTSIDIRENPKG
ncbi:MAG: T9SS type A sorting domain-containing protein, partial [Bacteroidales bacterium]|nr:T9SS type A sorting domain-containing protein [Bacteroidales bacterium]